MRRATPYECIAFACARLGVRVDEMVSGSRMPHVSLSRWIATGLSRLFTNASYPQIARAMCRLNHSSTINYHEYWWRMRKRERESIVAEFRTYARRHGITLPGDEYPEVSGSLAWKLIAQIKAAEAA